MSEINDLRERVEAAEERFGLMDEQQRHYSERLIGLIGTIEAQLADARGEIEKQIAENQRLGQENEELRTMLHSVLRSIEEKTFTQTLQNLETRVSALVSHAGATRAAAQEVTADAAPGPETGAEPQVDIVVEAEDSDPEAAETGAADPLIIEAADAAEAEPDAEPDTDTEPEMAAAPDGDGGESTEFEAAATEDAIDQGPPAEVATAEAEMPDTVAFEDADPEEIAAEAEAETVDELPDALAEESLQEAEAQFADAPEAEAPEAEASEAESPAAEAIEDDGQDAVADSGSDDEVPADFDTDGEAETAAGDEGEDIFAAMNLLNADDEDFAAAGQGTAPLDDDVSVHEAAAAEGDFAAPATAAPDTPEILEEPAAEVPVDAAMEAEDELSDAVAERLADEVPEELADSVAPTVKEIIRRVGDLARELERAETTRRNSHSDEHAAEAAGTPEPAMTETEGGSHPALDQAANG